MAGITAPPPSGAIGAGDVFSISRGGHLSVIYSFGAGLDGGNPAAKLLSDGSGTFYSTTYNNGAHGWGTVFSVTSEAASMWFIRSPAVPMAVTRQPV